MNIDTHLIRRYLNDEPLYSAEEAWIYRNADPVDQKRHDVVQELCRQLLDRRWPCFNHALYEALFPSLDTIVKETEIILIAAASDVPTYIRMHEGKAYLIIDLIQVANLTRIVAAMMHVIDNFICLETAMRCIAAEWPVSALSYTEKLDWICFRQGLANWLAWGEDSTVYQFPKGAKEHASALFKEAYQVSDPTLQHFILSRFPALPFWEQFPTVHGMFCFHEAFLRGGKPAICALYQKGWRSFGESC